MKTSFLKSALLGLLPAAALAAEPKTLLVVGATAAFRHPSIPNAERFLRQVEAESKGEIKMVFMSDVADYPFSKVPTPSGGGGGGRGRGGFPGNVTGASVEQQAAITNLAEPLVPLNNAVTAARTAVTAASLAVPFDAAALKARVEAEAAAESALAVARADALAKLQASANRLNADQVLALSGVAPAGGRGAGGRAGAPGPAGPGGGNNQNDVLPKIYQAYMSPEALKKYDGVFFVSSTGLQPIPDMDAFLKWVADGHGVMGIHAAMDTGAMPDSYMEMLAAGARFNGHPGNANAPSKVVRIDATSPLTKDYPATLEVTDEFYSYKWVNAAGETVPGVDFTKVHALLNLDRGDGVPFPVSWIKTYGKGRVFYTSMGHRDDVMLPDTVSMDYDGLKDNSDEVSAAFKRHVTAAIRWSLGLIEADATPGNLKR
jgi:type 1 glutamine amidotransferase